MYEKGEITTSSISPNRSNTRKFPQPPVRNQSSIQKAASIEVTSTQLATPQENDELAEFSSKISVKKLIYNYCQNLQKPVLPAKPKPELPKRPDNAAQKVPPKKSEPIVPAQKKPYTPQPKPQVTVPQKTTPPATVPEKVVPPALPQKNSVKVFTSPPAVESSSSVQAQVLEKPALPPRESVSLEKVQSLKQPSIEIKSTLEVKEPIVEKSIDASLDVDSSNETQTGGDDNDSDSIPNGEGITPLPPSYKVIPRNDGKLHLILPPPPKQSAIRSSSKGDRSVVFNEKNIIFETYNIYEYERGDDSFDPIAASAEYEVEKRLESLVKFEVELNKDNKGLGLNIMGVGLGNDSGSERLGIFIKSVTEGGVADKSGKIKVMDQILEVNGISLVGVSQKFAADTLRGTSSKVTLLMGRLEQNENEEK